MECKLDGSGSPVIASSRCSFKYQHANFLGCYASNISISFALYLELMKTILTIVTAFAKN